MIKFVFAAILLLVLADLGLNHGAQTARVGALIRAFADNVSHMGDGSIFGK